MIEFMISRVCLSVCGLVLLAAVIVPVTGMYESDAAGMESRVPDNIAELIDDFYHSKMEVLTISMSDILPNSSSYAEFGEYMITLTTARGVYKSGTNVPMISEEDAYGYHDMMRMSKGDGLVILKKIA